MTVSPEALADRLGMLGLTCEDVPLDRLTSATAALACLPMYMVANVHAWSPQKQWQLPIVDLPGSEAIREAFAIGRQEKRMEITAEHRRTLGTMLTGPRPSDRIVYEYALETLREFLEAADPAVAEQTRAAVARMIVAVAKASGEGLLGTGEKVSRWEKETIDRISETLNLESAPAAAEALGRIDG